MSQTWNIGLFFFLAEIWARQTGVVSPQSNVNRVAAGAAATDHTTEVLELYNHAAPVREPRAIIGCSKTSVSGCQFRACGHQGKFSTGHGPFGRPAGRLVDDLCLEQRDATEGKHSEQSRLACLVCATVRWLIFLEKIPMVKRKKPVSVLHTGLQMEMQRDTTA